ncbi:MAG TPA: glycosyltransferase [Stellaceae bacterium]|nr:glycosyltransferase [Stellaceae bacterium]
MIVCTHNRGELIERCLQAVIREAKNTCALGEIVVVDNASTDSTRERIEGHVRETGNGPPIRYDFVPEANLCLARNRGITLAEGEILIFLDDDAFPVSGWLASCLDAFEKFPKACAVGGEVRPLLQTSAPLWFRPPLSGLYTITDFGGTDIRAFPRRRHPVGANMAFRRHVFDHWRFSTLLGRSGAGLMSGDEAELFAAVDRGGGEVLYVPAMAVDHLIHSDRLTEKWVRRRFFFDGVSRAGMRLTFSARIVVFIRMAGRAFLLLLLWPFVRTPFRRLVWQCSLLKCVGYFGQLARVARFTPWF